MCGATVPGTYGKGNADAPRHAPRKISSHEPHPAYSPNKKDHNDCVRYSVIIVSSRGEGGGGMGGRGTELAPPEPLPLHRFLSTVPHSHHSDWEGKCVPSQLSSRARRLD